MTARRIFRRDEVAAELRRRIVGNPEFLGNLWDVLPRSERRAICAMHQDADLARVVDLPWDEIEGRERDRITNAMRRVAGLSSLLECVLR